MRRRALATTALALALMWLGWGVYFVAPDEEAVVRVLGRATAAPAGPGVHWNWPRPVGRVDKLKVREAKRLTLGFTAPDRVLGGESPAAEARWLTGDRNVVHVRLIVSYAIHDPLAYALRFQNVESVLEASGRSALLEVIAGMSVDELLTTGKVAVQQSVQAASQGLFDRFETGATVLSVSLEGVSPPSPVREAFNDVASAREDRDRLIREAESYRNEVVPVARGEARTLVAQAEASGPRKWSARPVRGTASGRSPPPPAATGTKSAPAPTWKRWNASCRGCGRPSSNRGGARSTSTFCAAS